jgi:hypothetical protein
MDANTSSKRQGPTAATRAAARAWGGAWLFVRQSAREHGVRGALPAIDDQVQGKRGVAAQNGIARLGQQMRATEIPLETAEEVAAQMARQIVRAQYTPDRRHPTSAA